MPAKRRPETIEITTRLGDTLLDVVQVERDFTLAGTPLVYDGQLVAPIVGRVGLVDYAASVVVKPARSVPFTRDTDRSWLPYVAAALVMHVGIWGLAAITHPPMKKKPKPVAERPLTVARIVAEPPPKQLPADDVSRDRVAGTKAQGEANAMAGAEGAAGMRAARASGHIAIKNRGEGAQLSKEEAIARARTAGILGSAQTVLVNYATLAGSDKLTSGFDGMDVNGASTNDDSAAGGSFGFGRSGFGPGGGGTGWGTIGSGRYGTIGGGTNGGHAWGGNRAPQPVQWHAWNSQYHGPYDYSPIPMRRLAKPSTVTICPPEAQCTVEGDLDKAIVRRYVKRNVTKLSYCFEKELLGQPDLRTGGTVKLSFAVQTDGTIELFQASGFSAEVTTCAAGVVAGIEMPARDGKTFVEYTLKFTNWTL